MPITEILGFVSGSIDFFFLGGQGGTLLQNFNLMVH
jgi:hypothetical protein